MAKPMTIGSRGEAQETVTFQQTLTAHHPSLPPVYSTPDMIRLMETAAFHALQPLSGCRASGSRPGRSAASSFLLARRPAR